MIAFFYLQLVMREFPEARMAYGESDEYSFILHKDTQLYGERDAVTDSPR
jgi:tRNA(His) 5'-end guanylyltransferase